MSATLDVLANDPGAARLYSLYQEVGTLARRDEFPVVTSASTQHGASISINADGTLAYDTSAIQHILQGLAAGEVFTDTFVYTVRMGNGALSTASATIELVGVTDIPILH